MMKAAQLRQSILQAAVWGKLVPQNPHDEPASVLLERIHSEKAKLIKAVKLKKEKPLLPVAEDEIPYELPSGWMWCRLSDVTEIVGGATPDTGQSQFYTQRGEGIPWLTPADMKYSKNNTISVGAKDITKVGYDSCSTKLIPEGSIVFSSRAPIGLIAFAGTQLRTNQGFKSMVPYDMSMKLWLFYYLTHHTDSIVAKASGTTFKEVSGEFMRKEIIPIPPLAEQQRIVNKLDGLMDMCDELEAAEKASDALDEHFAEYLTKSILQAAVQGKLVPQNPHDEPASVLLERIRSEKSKLVKSGKLKKDKPLSPIAKDEIAYDLPEGWEWCRLGEIADLKIGKTPARAENSYWSNGLYPWVSIADMTTGSHINSTKEKISLSAYEKVFKKAIVPKGSLLFSFKLSIGKVSILDIDAFTNEAICSITPYRHFELIDYLFRIIPVLDLLSGAKDAIKGKTLNSKSLQMF